MNAKQLTPDIFILASIQALANRRKGGKVNCGINVGVSGLIESFETQFPKEDLSTVLKAMAANQKIIIRPHERRPTDILRATIYNPDNLPPSLNLRSRVFALQRTLQLCI